MNRELLRRAQFVETHGTAAGFQDSFARPGHAVPAMPPLDAITLSGVGRRK
jgi:hypothetical protein